MSRIFKWSIISALAGFLFGFDTVVISGADQQLQDLWNTSDGFHGAVVIGMALWGTVLGAILGGIPTNKLGRKRTLIMIGVLYFVSAVGSALADNPTVFASFRFIGGLGVGCSTIAAPAYISEIAPKEKRGRLVALYQFNIVFGILMAYFSNYLLSDFGAEPWRWMIGVEAIPAFIYGLSVFFVPESPRWLLSRSKVQEAKIVLEKIDPGLNTKVELDRIKKLSGQKISSENIFMKKYRFPLILAFLIAFFNQLSGINAFLYYAPRIFESAGLAQDSALLSSIGIGVVNLIFTLIGMAMIDKLGRKNLVFIGSIGYIISLTAVSLVFLLGLDSIWVPIFLFLFIASHAIGQGTVIWVFISEIFPNHLRGSGQAFGSSIHWVLAAIVPSTIPFLFSSIGPGYVFAFFGFMMVLQLLFVIFMMPETKGRSLEDLSNELSNSTKTHKT